MRTLTEVEFLEWKQHPMTQALMDVLRAKREELKNQWEGGSFTDYTSEATVLVNVGNLGTCKGYAFVTDLTYEDYISEIEEDGKHKRVSAPGSSSTD